MVKDKDLVIVPNDWLPPNVLMLIEQSNKIQKGGMNFFTDDLGADGETFFINKDGYLIHEKVEMAVVHGLPEYNKGQTSLVMDTIHKPVINPRLKKLYTQIYNKLCILVVQFKENRIIDITSIIKPCTQ